MRYRYQYRGKIYEISLERHGNMLRGSLDGIPFEARLIGENPGELTLLLGDQPVTIHWADREGRKWIASQGCAYALEKPSPRAERKGGHGADGDVLRAPMPAQVRDVQAEVGDLVHKGETLMLLEAMKMEIRILAPRAGRISRLAVKAGQPVERDQVLAELAAASGEEKMGEG
jgi:biotin carboxyl carrier protein